MSRKKLLVGDDANDQTYTKKGAPFYIALIRFVPEVMTFSALSGGERESRRPYKPHFP
jgi:hypothetical protein